jgi:5'-nucleotidase
MRFLLTNDDGIDAPGLDVLRRAAEPLGECVTVAPNEHLSGCSHRVNTHRPLQAEEVSPGRYWLDGSPADCTRIGLLHLATETDWVLSGVNDGGNLGVDVHMSGTVAAVREAALLGRRGVALSQYRRRREAFPWDDLVPVVRRLLLWVFEHKLHEGAFWNLNLPDVGAERLREWNQSGRLEIAYCQLDPHPLPTEYELCEHGYVYRGVYGDRRRERGRDVDVCFSGRIAATQVLPPRSLTPDEIPDRVPTAE